VIATLLRDCVANYRGGQEASPKRFARISPTQISVLDQWLHIRYKIWLSTLREKKECRVTQMTSCTSGSRTALWFYQDDASSSPDVYIFFSFVI